MLIKTEPPAGFWENPCWTSSYKNQQEIKFFHFDNFLKALFCFTAFPNVGEIKYFNLNLNAISLLKLFGQCSCHTTVSMTPTSLCFTDFPDPNWTPFCGVVVGGLQFLKAELSGFRLLSPEIIAQFGFGKLTLSTFKIRHKTFLFDVYN